MPQIVKQSFSTKASEGEITINLNFVLTIRMENGQLSISSDQAKVELDKPKIESEPAFGMKEYELEIPDIIPGELLDFGTSVEQESEDR